MRLTRHRRMRLGLETTILFNYDYRHIFIYIIYYNTISIYRSWSGKKLRNLSRVSKLRYTGSDKRILFPATIHNNITNWFARLSATSKWFVLIQSLCVTVRAHLCSRVTQLSFRCITIYNIIILCDIDGHKNLSFNCPR